MIRTVPVLGPKSLMIRTVPRATLSLACQPAGAPIILAILGRFWVPKGTLPPRLSAISEFGGGVQSTSPPEGGGGGGSLGQGSSRIPRPCESHIYHMKKKSKKEAKIGLKKGCFRGVFGCFQILGLCLPLGVCIGSLWDLEYHGFPGQPPTNPRSNGNAPFS